MSCEHMNLTVRQEELGIHNALASIHSKVQCTEERQEADSVERLHRPQQRELVKLTCSAKGMGEVDRSRAT